MYYGRLKEFARELRKKQTPAEQFLWKILQGRQLGDFKFRRQHIINQFIADFVCLEKKLIIELDGGIHSLPENQVNDELRTQILNKSGFTVIRFRNEEVLYSPETTINSILNSLQSASFPKKDEGRSASPPLTGGADYIGAFAVTSGIGIEKWVQYFEDQHDDYHAIMLKALADRLAEALAERLHERVRREFWGYATKESLDHEQRIAEQYQGIRPAPGYPACPEHTEKQTLWQLLQPDQLGITLTESCAMYPAASVSGWYFAHPEAKYFGLGQIAKDQVEDYARRKGMTVAMAERWLAPVLNYDV